MKANDVDPLIGIRRMQEYVQRRVIAWVEGNRERTPRGGRGPSLSDTSRQQSALAVASGLSPAILTGIVKKGVLPSADGAMAALASALGIGMKELLDAATHTRSELDRWNAPRMVDATGRSMGDRLPRVVRDAAARWVLRQSREPTTREIETRLRFLLDEHARGNIYDCEDGGD